MVGITGVLRQCYEITQRAATDHGDLMVLLRCDTVAIDWLLMSAVIRLYLSHKFSCNLHHQPSAGTPCSILIVV